VIDAGPPPWWAAPRRATGNDARARPGHQLHALVDARNTVVVLEHHMHVIAGSDWVLDIGPSAGEEGGRVVAAGPPAEVARAAKSRTAPYLARVLG
jgi:excinuclease ABC subunit A